nr:ribonuclease H-like domain-containing protein [Tanacetum cinerariifolium]
MQLLMGLYDIYWPIRSSLLTRKILPEVKDAFGIIVKEESHREISPTSVKNDKPKAFVFISSTNDNRRDNNGNWNNNDVNTGNKGNYNSLLWKDCSLKGHSTVDKCFKIIGYLLGFNRNPNLKPYSNFNNNRNNNVDARGAFVGTNDIKTSTGTMSFTTELVLKLTSLINDIISSTAHATMELIISFSG